MAAIGAADDCTAAKRAALAAVVVAVTVSAVAGCLDV
jgi:hypothetical protein